MSSPEVLAQLRVYMALRHHVSEQNAAARITETGEALLVPKLELGELRARDVVGHFREVAR